MRFDTIDELYSHFRQFRIPRGVQGSGEANCFWEITESELVAAEKEMGISIPAQLRRFYKEVGNGHVVVDENGTCNIDYFNIILDLDRMVEFWKRTEVSFDYDADIVDEGDLAFFDIGSYSYKVFRPLSGQPDAIFNPYDQKPLAENFNEFILKLYENTIFYLDHEGVYED